MLHCNMTLKPYLALTMAKKEFKSLCCKHQSILGLDWATGSNELPNGFKAAFKILDQEECFLMRHLGKTICVCWEKEMRLGGRKVWDAVWSLHRVDEKWAAEGEEPGDAAMWQKREMAYIKMKWCFAKLDGAAAVLVLWGRGPTSKLFPETSARRQNGFQAVVRSSFQGDLLSVCSPKAQQYAAKVVSIFFTANPIFWAQDILHKI